MIKEVKKGRCKYLRILELNQIKGKGIIDEFNHKYMDKTRLIMKSKLN